MSVLVHDVRYAVRRPRRSPGFVATAAGTLGLGLGAATLLFAAVHTVLLRPLPFADQHELVLMWEQDVEDGSPHVEVSLPHFQDWRAQASSFSHLAAIGSTDWGDLEVRASEPFALSQRVVSGSFFDTLGVSAAVGRTLRPADDVAGAAAVVVLSHDSWRRHFSADPQVVGDTLTVVGRDEPLLVVGVMPPGFEFPAGTDAWVPVVPALANVVRQREMTETQQRGLGMEGQEQRVAGQRFPQRDTARQYLGPFEETAYHVLSSPCGLGSATLASGGPTLTSTGAARTGT